MYWSTSITLYAFQKYKRFIPNFRGWWSNNQFSFGTRRTCEFIDWRICWLFNGCPHEFVIMFHIIIEPGWPNRSCQIEKFVNFWFTVTFVLAKLIFVQYKPEENAGNFSSVHFLPEFTFVIQRYSTFSSFNVSIWYPFRRISLKLNKFLWALEEYNAFSILTFPRGDWWPKDQKKL